MNTHTTQSHTRIRLLGIATLTTLAFAAVGCGTTATTTTSGVSSNTTEENQAPSSVLTELPADADILTGLPSRNGHDQTKVVVRDGFDPQAPGPCGQGGLSVTDATQVRSAVYTGESEGGMERVVALFDTSEAAQAAVDAVRNDATTCESTRITTHVGTATTPDVLRFANAYDTGEGFAYELIAAGNVVVYTTTFFQSAQDAAVREETFDLLTADSAELLTAVREGLSGS